MRFSPLSFALGLAAASIIPALSRVFRPFAVEAAAAGLGMLDDARRFASERRGAFAAARCRGQPGFAE